MDRLGSTWRLSGRAGAGSVVTDECLAAGAGAGNGDAFHSLAQRYSQPAFGYAYHILGTFDDADDAVQETLIQVFQSLPTARQDLPFRPWFYRILRNKCLDALRRRRPFLRYAEAGDDDSAVDDSPADVVADAAALPEEVYERRDLQRLLHEVIAELPPKYRDVVLLRYVTDLTFDEMSATLSIPVNTVKTRFQRAKHMLRPLLLARQAIVAPHDTTGADEGPGRPGGPSRKEDGHGEPR